MYTASSISSRLLSTRAARALLGLACVASLSTAGASLAFANAEPEFHDTQGLSAPSSMTVCGVSTIHARVDPADGSIMYGIPDSAGTFHYVEANDIEIGFNGLSRVNLRVWLVGTEGVLEVSPDDEETEMLSTWRERVTLRFDEESSTQNWAKDYFIAFLDPSGQELPAVPKIQVKTKKTCPAAPILPGGGED